jgi:mRNA interferase MazF
VIAHPARGEVWLTDFGVPHGHEVGHRRPALVVTSDRLNRAAAVAVVVPMISRERHLPTSVRISLREGTGLSEESWAKVDHVKSISAQRLEEHLGEIDLLTMARVEEALRLILEI